MTFATVYFNHCKKEGQIRKIGRASFFDGMRRMERTLYHNESDNADYVILNGEAHHFKAYTNQNDPEIIKGHI